MLENFFSFLDGKANQKVRALRRKNMEAESNAAASRLSQPELVAYLLEEGLWNPRHGTDSVEHPTGPRKADQLYLEKEVFPTLVPALHDLLELVQARLDDASEPAIYGPTGSSHPLDWLAQFLMRRNTRHDAALHNHSYCVLRRALKEHEEGVKLAAE